MRILALTPSLPAPSEGGVLRAFHLLKHLHQRHGHQITLISLLEQPPRAGSSPTDLEFCADVQTIAVPRSGTPAKWLYGLWAALSPQHLLNKSHTFLNPGYSPAMHRKVRAGLASDRFDVVFACSLYSAFYAWDIGLPKVVDTIDAMPEGWRKKIRETNGLNLPYKLYLRLMCNAHVRETKRVYEKGFYALTATSVHEADMLRDYVPRMNIVPIPNGVDGEYFTPRGDAAEESSVVFTGAMSAAANVDAVLRFHRAILPHIREQIPNVRFYVVGQEPPAPIVELQRDPQVIVTGFVPDVRPYLERACVAVVPLWSGQGISNKMLEAMAMAKSVVATPAQAHGIALTPGVHAAIVDCPREFAEQVVALLKDKARRRAMGRAARALVEERYTWTAASNRLHTLLEEAVDAG